MIINEYQYKKYFTCTKLFALIYIIVRKITNIYYNYTA